MRYDRQTSGGKGTRRSGKYLHDAPFAMFMNLWYLMFLRPQIAREHGIRFMETSAKANINIERAFCELAEAILDATSGKDNPENPERVVVDRRGQEKQPAYKGCCA